VAFVDQLGPIYADYLAAQVALAGDGEDMARKALEQISGALDAVDEDPLEGEALSAWTSLAKILRGHLGHLDHAAGMEGLRKAFFPISNTMIRMTFVFGHHQGQELNLAFCPMARDDQGAHWLQYGEVISNPYFGSAMLRCGEIQRTFTPRFPAQQDGEGGLRHDE